MRIPEADFPASTRRHREICEKAGSQGRSEPPLRLSVEASRDLALSLEGRRPDEAQRRWAQASKLDPQF